MYILSKLGKNNMDLNMDWLIIVAILKISDIWKLQRDKKQLVLPSLCQIYLSQ